MFMEYISDYDKHNFYYESGIEIDTDIVIKSSICHIKSKDDSINIRISDIEAENEDDAFKKVENIIHEIKIVLSHVIQKQNQNQHYGHIRLNNKKKEISILPRDYSISENVGIKLTQIIKKDTIQEYFDAALNNSDLRFVLNSYHNSVGPYDLRSKFFNAFTIIEFIEKKYSDSLNVTPLLPLELLDNIKNHISDTLKEKEVQQEIISRTVSRVNEFFINATFESRKKKLLLILKDIFKIDSITYITKEIQIDEQLCDVLIKYRNNLFHGNKKEIDNLELKEKLEKLILICERVVSYYLLKKE